MSVRRMANDRHPRDQGGVRQGPSGNRGGRPKKPRTVDDEILKAARERVTVTENGARKRISKAAANAKKLVNSGVTGTSREAKAALEMAQKAEERAAANAPSAAMLLATDLGILERFVARVRRAWEEEKDHDPAEA